MTSAFITPGRHHALWKEWRRIGKGQDERFFLEHRQAVLESLEGSNPPRQVLLSQQLYGHESDSWDRLVARHRETQWYLIEGQSLDDVASVPANSGFCGLFDPRPSALESILRKRFVMIAWDLADPGNLGTLIRATQALGDGALLCVGGCDPWSAKVARASAGSLLKAELARTALEGGEELLGSIQAAGFAVHAAYPRAETDLAHVAWTGKDAILLGNETRGLPASLGSHARPFRISTSSAVESLNVAMTGSIVAWEWRKSAVGRPEQG